MIGKKEELKISTRNATFQSKSNLRKYEIDEENWN